MSDDEAASLDEILEGISNLEARLSELRPRYSKFLAKPCKSLALFEARAPQLPEREAKHAGLIVLAIATPLVELLEELDALIASKR